MQCIESIDKGTQDEVKQSFNRMIRTLDLEYDKTEMKKLPGLFYEAGEIMSSWNDKKSTVDYYWNASKLYEQYYGLQNIFVPLTIKKIGDYLFRLEDYANAIAYYKASIDSRLNFTNDHLASCKIRIGICYLQLDHYQAAENILVEVLELYLGLQVQDSTAIGNIYNNLASVNAKSQNLDKASDYYRTALCYYPTNLDKEKLNQAFINNNLGNLLLERKNYSGANALYKKSLKVRQKALPGKSIELTQSYYNIGYCFSNMGMLDSALLYCQRSIVSNALGFHNLDITTNPSNSICLSKSDLLTSLLDKGEYLIKLYQLDSIKHIDRLIEAKKTLKVGEELFHEVEGKILNFKSKIAWSSRNNRLSNLLIYVEFLMNTSTDSSIALLAEADYKRNLIHKSYTRVNEAIAGRSIEYSLFEQNKQISYINDSGISSAMPSNQLSGYFQFDTIMPRQQIEKIDRSSIASIQSKLKSNQVVVSFAICDSLIIRHVISDRRIEFKPLISTELRESIFMHLKQIKTYGDYSPTGKSIYNTLFGDIDKQIEPFKELIIIPDEYLFNLPFETLIVDDNGNFLIDRHEISYSFSISKLLDNEETKYQDYKFIGFSPMGKQRLSYGLDDYSKLEYADKEIDKISELFLENSLETIKHMGSEATIIELLKIKDTSSFIHIATHNIVNAKNPWMSYIQFYPDSSFSNGKLYLPIIYSFGANATCLILSGCGTGVGKINNNDGVLSVAHAFSCNPIKNLVLSLWNIDDKSTSEFMVELYEEIVKGKSIAESLSFVKREYINSDFKHPYFWSSILHYYN